MLLNIMSDMDHIMSDAKNEMDVLFRTCTVYTVCPHLIFSSGIVKSPIFSVLRECLLTGY